MGDLRDSASSRYVTPQDGDAWASDAAAQGKVGTQRLLDVQTLVPPDDVQAALELAPGEQAVVRRRLINADGEPVELADPYYPASIAAGTALAEARKIKGGAVRVLAEAGYRAAEVDDIVSARQPDADEADLLKIGATEPIIVLARVSRSAQGRPIEFALNRMVASRTAPLSYRMRADAQ